MAERRSQNTVRLMLINNAAMFAGLKQRPMDVPVEEWDRLMAVNVKAHGYAQEPWFLK
jgi:NAD(P)-dependent dehydrogenase (short-subunit alcohol dehydrogenase family)